LDQNKKRIRSPVFELRHEIRGGRARGRNWRARQRTLTTFRLTAALSTHPTVETTAQAIASLDDQFPWLYQAERRGPRR
jgi:hypothetical protein